jgi:hypothetical protein
LWQLLQQFPTAFEFNPRLLLATMDHVHSCLFGKVASILVIKQALISTIVNKIVKQILSTPRQFLIGLLFIIIGRPSQILPMLQLILYCIPKSSIQRTFFCGLNTIAGGFQIQMDLRISQWTLKSRSRNNIAFNQTICYLYIDIDRGISSDKVNVCLLN